MENKLSQAYWNGVLTSILIGTLFIAPLAYCFGKENGKKEERIKLTRDISQKVTEGISYLDSRMLRIKNFDLRNRTNENTRGYFEGIDALKNIYDNINH